MRAAVELLHGKRLRALRKAPPSAMPGDGERVRRILDGYWRHVRQPLYAAFAELAVAARTDRELAAVLGPLQEAFEREWHRTARQLFPEWQGREQQLELALDLSRYLMEGVAASLLSRRETERDLRLLRHLERTLGDLLGG